MSINTAQPTKKQHFYNKPLNLLTPKLKTSTKPINNLTGKPVQLYILLLCILLGLKILIGIHSTGFTVCYKFRVITSGYRVRGFTVGYRRGVVYQ